MLLCSSKVRPEKVAGPARSVGCAVRLVFWRSQVRSSVSWRSGHEIISMGILSLPLIQVGQLSVTDESMGT